MPCLWEWLHHIPGMVIPEANAIHYYPPHILAMHPRLCVCVCVRVTQGAILFMRQVLILFSMMWGHGAPQCNQIIEARRSLAASNPSAKCPFSRKACVYTCHHTHSPRPEMK